jgi:hypothetical protein
MATASYRTARFATSSATPPAIVIGKRPRHRPNAQKKEAPASRAPPLVLTTIERYLLDTFSTAPPSCCHRYVYTTASMRARCSFVTPDP